MRWMERDWWLVGVWLALSFCAVARGQAPLTNVADTVYRADGTAAAGSITVSWPAFTTGDGTAVPAGTTSVTLGSGGALNVSLIPNAGSAPMGTYYTAVYSLSDGTVSKEFWVVPVSVPGGGPAKLAGIRNQVLPTSLALQTVSKAYVDNTVAKAVTGTLPAAAPWVVKTGDAMSGPLALVGDPVNANHAADKHYVDTSVAAVSSGAIAASRLPVFGASGSGHAVGAVPDPGATAGATKFLREDGTWVAPAGGGGSPTGSASGDLSGSYPAPTVSAVHATSGTMDGVAVGQTTPSAGAFTGIAIGNSQITFPITSSNTEYFGNTGGFIAHKVCFSRAGVVQLCIDSNNDAVTTVHNTLDDGSGAAAFGGQITAAAYGGPSSAPSGSCATSGVWVFSQDGHATFCNAGTWVVKI